MICRAFRNLDRPTADCRDRQVSGNENSCGYRRMFEVRRLFNYTPWLCPLGFQPIVKSGHVGGARPVPPEQSQTSPAIGRKRFRCRRKLEGESI